MESCTAVLAAWQASLPPVLYRCRVLCPLCVPLAIEAHNGDYLLGALGIERDQREAVLAVHVGEVGGLLVANVWLDAEEAQAEGVLSGRGGSALGKRCLAVGRA